MEKLGVVLCSIEAYTEEFNDFHPFCPQLFVTMDLVGEKYFWWECQFFDARNKIKFKSLCSIQHGAQKQIICTIWFYQIVSSKYCFMPSNGILMFDGAFLFVWKDWHNY